MLLRYPPTLLERLQDDEPKNIHDRLKPVDMRTMRNIVKKDLTDLINHSNMETKSDVNKYSPASSSVLNYGISALAGTQGNSHSWGIIEQKIRKAILNFEPRIIPETLVVRSIQQGGDMIRHAVIAVEIRGLIHWKPKPIDLCMSGRYDFESEKVDLSVL